MSGEPSNFNARAMARWLASRGRPHAKRQPPGPRPTLAELQRSHCWTWVYCEKCLHHAPMALVPLIIRWGAETSSDRLRQRARCTKCGHKGATLQHPGWAGTHIGFQPFPCLPHPAPEAFASKNSVGYVASTRSIRLGSSAGARELLTRLDTGQRCSTSFAAGLSNVESAVVEPGREILGFKDNRHAVMHFGNEIVRLGDEHRA